MFGIRVAYFLLYTNKKYLQYEFMLEICLVLFYNKKHNLRFANLKNGVRNMNKRIRKKHAKYNSISGAIRLLKADIKKNLQSVDLNYLLHFMEAIGGELYTINDSHVLSFIPYKDLEIVSIENRNQSITSAGEKDDILVLPDADTPVMFNITNSKFFTLNIPDLLGFELAKIENLELMLLSSANRFAELVREFKQNGALFQIANTYEANYRSYISENCFDDDCENFPGYMDDDGKYHPDEEFSTECCCTKCVMTRFVVNSMKNAKFVVSYVQSDVYESTIAFSPNVDGMQYIFIGGSDIFLYFEGLSGYHNMCDVRDLVEGDTQHEFIELMLNVIYFLHYFTDSAVTADDLDEEE